MSSIRVQVDKVCCEYSIQTSQTGLTRVVTLTDPIGENSKIRIYLDNYDTTEYFTDLNEFNNQHGASGNLLGRYVFSCPLDTENIILEVDVESKFNIGVNRIYLDKWKNNIQELVKEIEGDFGKNYIRKYLIYSIYGYRSFEKTNYENIADIIVKNYSQLIKCYNYIVTNNIFKNTVSNIYFNEYAEANSVKSDVYNDIFGDQNPDVQWHEKVYVKYDTDEIVYLHYMFYRFCVNVDECIKSISSLSKRSSHTESNRTTYKETLDALKTIRKKFSVIGINCPIILPKRALHSKRYRFIYSIYKIILNKCDLMTDFSKKLEEESLASINYLNKLYEIAVFKKIVNIVRNKIMVKPECMDNDGLMYKFVLGSYAICIYYPYCGKLSAVGLESVAICDKESKLDIIVTLEVDNELSSCIVFDAKYKYYGFYDECIGQMVRYANAVSSNGKLVVSNCYLVFPFNKGELNNINTVDEKYHILLDDLYKDTTLEFILDSELSAIDNLLQPETEVEIFQESNSKEILTTYTINNIIYTVPRKTIEYNDDQTIKTFNIPSNANSDLVNAGIYRVNDNNSYWVKWGKWRYGEHYHITNALFDKSYEIKVSMFIELELPARLLEYAYGKDKEKTIEFMNSVEWCMYDNKYKGICTIKETGYNYNLSHMSNISFNRVYKILREFHIELEILIPKEVFWGMFKTLDIDKCYQDNINLEEFLSVSEVKNLILIGTRIEYIYIKTFNFKVSTYAEALHILLCYLVFIEYVEIDKMLDISIISNDALKYRKPNVIPSTNLFYEYTEVPIDSVAVMEILSKMYDVDIKLKININEDS